MSFQSVKILTGVSLAYHEQNISHRLSVDRSICERVDPFGVRRKMMVTIDTFLSGSCLQLWKGRYR